MPYILLILMLVSIFPLSADGSDVEYSEEYNNTTVVKTVDGIRFQVPEDRPIERGEGYIRPMPLDAYVSMKFSKLESRLQAMEGAINTLTSDVSSIKEDMKALKKASGAK